MAIPSGKLVTFRRKVPEASYSQATAETELQELEKEIGRNRNRPLSILLAEIIQRIGSVTGADGAAIALCDQWGVICRASAGDAPDVGSRLHPDSALTRECFEIGPDAREVGRGLARNAKGLAVLTCFVKTPSARLEGISTRPAESRGTSRQSLLPGWLNRCANQTWKALVMWSI